MRRPARGWKWHRFGLIALVMTLAAPHARLNYGQKLFLLATLPLILTAVAVSVVVTLQSRQMAEREIETLEAQLIAAKRAELRNYISIARTALRQHLWPRRPRRRGGDGTGQPDPRRHALRAGRIFLRVRLRRHQPRQPAPHRTDRAQLDRARGCLGRARHRRTHPAGALGRRLSQLHLAQALDRRAHADGGLCHRPSGLALGDRHGRVHRRRDRRRRRLAPAGGNARATHLPLSSAARRSRADLSSSSPGCSSPSASAASPMPSSSG